MKTRFLLSLLAMLCIAGVHAQQAPTSTFLITVTNPGLITQVNREGGSVNPVFENSGINSIFSHYQLSEFKQAFPSSNYEYLRQMWRVTSNSLQLAKELKEAYPKIFPAYEVLGEAKPLAHYPNDMNMWYDDYLDFIKAPDAWDCSKGSSDVLIGITDTYFKDDHPDLQPKIAELWQNIYPGSHFNHGTLVSGIAAGATNNGIGYPSIGYNCMLRLSNNWADDNEMLLMSQAGSRVLNGSWLNGITSSLNLNTYGQGIYNEIYENGTVPCFGAGNGYGSPDDYCYPASYDHNIAVTHVGWENVYNGINNFNVKEIHEITIGNVSGTYQHNDRVDICAPAVRIGGLDYDPNNSSVEYTWDGGWGTSFASPMVAGTLGLMVSAKPALSPYQLEYILKMNAVDISMWLDNVKYGARHTGKLGSGRLDAAAAVCAAKYFNANDAATQTMYIQGIEVNTHCKPGSSTNGVIPRLTPIVINGTGPLTYRWEALGGNTAILDNYTSSAPQIVGSSGTNLAYFRLTVYDNSTIRKVANRIIKLQLTTAQVHNLAMRDADMDMFDEPNNMSVVNSRDWNIWLSPDVWNRQHQDGGTKHQNPEYMVTNSNYMYGRVRNVGCAPSPAANLRLYWSKASTGEKWAVDWTTINVPGAPGLGLVPGGREITTGGPLPILPLQPGTSVIVNRDWLPPNPANFAGSPSYVDACVLARVEETPGFPHGMTIPEITGNVKTNVINNNNIVTRNFIITDLKPGNGASEKRSFDFANAENAATFFRLQVINDRLLNPSYSGDFAEMATATLYLGDLFQRWEQGGMQGTQAGVDREARTVTFDGNSAVELDNIQLAPGERFTLDIEFTLNNGATLTNSQHMIHARQFEMSNLNDVYGNVTYTIEVKETADGQEGAPAQPAGQNNLEEKHHIAVYPNPAKDKISIYYEAAADRTVDVAVYDVTGREVYSKSGVVLTKSAYDINLAAFIPGVYFIEVSDGKAFTERFKFIKQ